MAYSIVAWKAQYILWPQFFPSLSLLDNMKAAKNLSQRKKSISYYTAGTLLTILLRQHCIPSFKAWTSNLENLRFVVKIHEMLFKQ